MDRVAYALSKREKEVLRLGATGATDQQISERPSVSVPTLRTYWLRIRRKVGGVNRTHAIALAVVGTLAADKSDPQRRVVERARARSVADWAWRPAERQVILGDVSKLLFGVEAEDGTVSLDRMVAAVWAPDRPRMERFLAQSTEFGPLTPLDVRVGCPGGEARTVRTVNLSTHRSRQDGVTVLLASAVGRTVP